jgi:hypothetical protein
VQQRSWFARRDELKHWFDDAIFDVKFSGGDVPGKRKSPRILLRSTADGGIAMIFDKGRTDPNLGAMLASGTGEIHYRIPNPRAWRVAALKHAYLAACLSLGDVPNTEHAAYVRGVLVATRDGERGSPPPETGLTKGLRFGSVTSGRSGSNGAAGGGGGRGGQAAGLRALSCRHLVRLVVVGRPSVLGRRAAPSHTAEPAA